MPSYLAVTYIIQLVTLLIGLTNWSRLKLAYKLILIQVLLALIADFSAWVVSHYWHAHNGIIFNSYNVLELWLLGLAVYAFISHAQFKKFIRFVLPILTLSWLTIIIIKGPYVFNNWIVLVEAIFYLISFVFVLFNNSLFSAKEIYKQPLFLIAISVILYFSTIIPLFGLLNYLVESDANIARKLYQINNVANPVRYALVAIAFYLYAREAKRGYVPQ